MENKSVSWVLGLHVKSGKVEALTKLAEEMSAATQANEPNTLNYEWYIDPEKQQCHIYENYLDSTSVLIHLNNFQAFADRFFDCLDVQFFYVYGNPSQEIRDALGGFNAVFLSQLAGYTRQRSQL